MSDRKWDVAMHPALDQRQISRILDEGWEPFAVVQPGPQPTQDALEQSSRQPLVMFFRRPASAIVRPKRKVQLQ